MARYVPSRMTRQRQTIRQEQSPARPVSILRRDWLDGRSNVDGGRFRRGVGVASWPGRSGDGRGALVGVAGGVSLVWSDRCRFGGAVDGGITSQRSMTGFGDVRRLVDGSSAQPADSRVGHGGEGEAATPRLHTDRVPREGSRLVGGMPRPGRGAPDTSRPGRGAADPSRLGPRPRRCDTSRLPRRAVYRTALQFRDGRRRPGGSSGVVGVAGSGPVVGVHGGTR